MLKGFKKVTHSVVNTVNIISRPTNKTIDALVSRTIRKQFLNDLVSADKRQLLTGTLSEASVRIGKEYILTHGVSRHLGDLSDDDLDIRSIDSDWALKRQPAPTHIRWHQWVYQTTTAKAILVCHPLHVFKLWARNKELQDPGLGGAFTIPDGFLVCDKEDVEQMIPDHPCLLVSGQGMLNWGESLRELIWKIGDLDWICGLVI